MTARREGEVGQTEAPYVSVLVLNWNGARLLPRCLAALGGRTTPVTAGRR